MLGSNGTCGRGFFTGPTIFQVFCMGFRQPVACYKGIITWNRRIHSEHLETRQSFQVWNWLMLCTSGKMLSTRVLCALTGLLSHTWHCPWSSEKAARKPSGKQLWDKKPAWESGSGRSSRSCDLEEHEQGHGTGQEYVVKWQRLQGREKRVKQKGDRTKEEKKDLSGNKEVEPETDGSSWNRRWGVLLDNRKFKHWSIGT